jgi:hypothetical protein
MTSQLSHSQGHSDCSAYEVPVNVAWVDGSEYGYDGDLYLTKVPEGDTVLLRGSSRLIWLAAVESPDPLAEVCGSCGPASVRDRRGRQFVLGGAHRQGPVEDAIASASHQAHPAALSAGAWLAPGREPTARRPGSSADNLGSCLLS